MSIKSSKGAVRAFSLLVLSFFALIIASCTVTDFDKVYNLTIRYYYNDANDNNKVKSNDLVMIVKKGDKLQGGPLVWDSRWPSNSDSVAKFGYVGDGRQGAENVNYIYESKNGIWQFDEISGDGSPTTLWDTSMVINHSLVLVPKYEKEGGDEELSIYFKYNKPDSNSQKGFTEVVEKRTVLLSEVNKGNVNLSSLDSGDKELELFKLDKDKNFAFGYTDLSDHGKMFFYDKLKKDGRDYSEYVVYDNDGNVVNTYSTLNTVISASMSDYVFCPKYIAAGYKNIESKAEVAGGLPGVEQVFIPGNVNTDGTLSPFPYTRAGSDAISISSASGNNNSINDSIEKKLAVPNMYVMDTFVPSSLVKAAKAKVSGYTFLSSNYDEHVRGEYFVNTSYIEAMMVANLITEYYNAIHPQEEPLKCVYYAKFNKGSRPDPNTTTFKNENVLRSVNLLSSGGTASTAWTFPHTTLTSTVNYTHIYVDPSANGFRLPYHYEWEYWARIITNEQTLPDLSKNVPSYRDDIGDFHTVIRPTSDNKLKNYFQSVLGRVNSSSPENLAYVGSGAGLAAWDKAGNRYDPLRLRNWNDIAGRTGNTATGVAGNLKKDSNNSEEDNNRKNGAGLWGMTGTYFCITNTFISSLRLTNSTDCGVVKCGASFSTPLSGSSEQPFNAFTTSLSPTDANSFVSIRLCRNAR